MYINFLLTKGYFPKELPQPFTSENLGSVLTSGPSLPVNFSEQKVLSLPVVHNIARAGGLRRKLSIPNPINYYRLSSFFETNWTELIYKSRRFHISLTTPNDASEPRAINPRCPMNDRVLERARIRARSRFILQADISRFYPSIYTHSIPWAIHSKPTAKANRSSNLIGNELDMLIRNAQDGQTLGIPIGPDTSLLVAEIILGAVDEELLSKVETVGFRYIDDYELGFNNYSDAKNTLGMMQEILSKYELDLNPLKTRILELPFPIESTWVSEIRSFHFRNSKLGQQSDIIRYFDRILEIATSNPYENVLKYAIAALDAVKIREENWTLYEDLLLHCCLIEPGVVQFVLNQLARYQKVTYPLNIVKIGDCFNQFIIQHAPLGHGSVVAWALWTIILFGIHVDPATANAISAMDDSVVALLALDARDKGIISKSQSFDRYQTYMTNDELYGNQWMLSYEANIKGWLPSLDQKDYVKSDPCFGYLKSNGVYFYDNSLDINSLITKPIVDIVGGGVSGGGDGTAIDYL